MKNLDDARRGRVQDFPGAVVSLQQEPTRYVKEASETGMRGVVTFKQARQVVRAALALLFFLPAAPHRAAAQSVDTQGVGGGRPQAARAAGLRLGRVTVANGAELLTVFGGLGRPREAGAGDDVPLVSILRDTLGDADRENDRLRYVWMHTYTRPSVGQRAAAAVPFLYGRVGSRRDAGGRVPPHVLDLAAADRDVWRSVFWTALQNILLDPYGLALKASTRAYRRNADDYRRAHVLRALAVLSLYEAETGDDSVFTPQEMGEIQARLMLTQKTLGGVVDDLYLQRVYEKETTQWRDHRGHNWELLRQRAEAEGLYFEPLELPDGSATHALLWVAKDDLARPRGRKYEKRFLNVADPWRDGRLRGWKGYTETRHFDAESRPCAPDAPGARAVELIPLALYGLEHPKIPILLIDFRDTFNPKGRELSRRALQDVLKTTLAVSRFNLAYLLGRAVYDFVTDRRGMDLNQPSRVRTYTQLKLLLSLDASLDTELRGQIERRLERVSLNPLENDADAEARLARGQYAALLEFARRPDGLAKRLDRDRRAEMVAAEHGKTERVLLKLANTLSFGLYTHRERATWEQQAAALDAGRRLAYHRRFLREVAKSSAQVEVQWEIGDVRRSLQFVAENGRRADDQTAAAVARIFSLTRDDEARRLCLLGLYRIDNERAKSSLVRIYKDEAQDARWRQLSADYLRRAAREEQRISQDDARVIATMAGGR